MIVSVVLKGKVMSNSGKIITYCLDNLVNKPAFVEYMKAESNWFLSELDKYDVSDEIKTLSKGIKRQIGMQKLLHAAMWKEVMVICNSSENIVGLKGLFLEKIYYPSNVIRFYDDIDIIVEDKLGYRTFSFLKSIGYELEKKKGLADNKNWAITLMKSKYFQRTHHVVLKKYIGAVPIELELHGNINRCKSCSLNFDRHLMNVNAVLRRCDNLELFVFKPEENIVYLMYHCIKHLSYTSYIISNNYRVNLQKFYDIAQIVTTENINWYEFTLTVCKSNTAPFVSLFLKMFCAIFPDMVPTEVVSVVNDEAIKTEYKWKKTYDCVMKQRVEDVLMGTWCDKV